ncbi:TetR/AcrR family transcriptional regulator [Saccharomonospora sp. NPDC006951]
MDQRRTAPAPRVRMTLAERKRETREALVLAALSAFARDGYHAASLEAIATEAGYSKGAIYSNFAGKAELFLAVMDYNLEALRGDGWNPLSAERAGNGRAETAAPEEDAAMMVRGVGLATLEFIATAARDDTLTEALRARVQGMVDSYRQVAAEARGDDDALAADDVARLMAALDQGASILTLSGITAMDGTLLRTGLRRLLSPEHPAPESGDRGSPLPDVRRVQRLMGHPDET